MPLRNRARCCPRFTRPVTFMRRRNWRTARKCDSSWTLAARAAAVCMHSIRDPPSASASMSRHVLWTTSRFRPSGRRLSNPTRACRYRVTRHAARWRSCGKVLLARSMARTACSAQATCLGISGPWTIQPRNFGWSRETGNHQRTHIEQHWVFRRTPKVIRHPAWPE